MDSRTGCFKGPVRVFSRSEDRLEDDDNQKRRRVLAKKHLVKRLRMSLHDWNLKKSRFDRRTTARESTIALLRKTRMRKENIDVSSVPIDPITREKLSRNSPDILTFKRGNSVASLDAAALIDYILSSGDYCDPESRVPFDDATLRKLDQIGSKLGKPSVIQARTGLQAKLAERQFIRDAICGLERVCGESVAHMFELVESVHERKTSMDEAQMQLLTFILPEFQSNFEQLAQADHGYAENTAEQFETFLRGPPNKPVKNSAVQSLVLELFHNSVREALKTA